MRGTEGVATPPTTAEIEERANPCRIQQDAQTPGAGRPRRGAGRGGVHHAVFALLIFGILEFGLTFRDYLTVANVSRDSARGASAYGDDLYADYNIIQVAKQSSKGFRPNEIRRLIVFDAGSVNGSIFNSSHPANACLTAHGRHHRRLQRLHSDRPTRAQDRLRLQAHRDLDRFWCPTDREVRASGPPDYIGVYVQARHDFVTGLFGPGMDLTDEIIMRIEPQDF